MKTVWSVCHEPQRCIWTDGNAEVDIQPWSTELSEHATEADALRAVEALLDKLGALATWASVRPIEACARCGADFNTSDRHSTIALLKEARDENGAPVEELDSSYPARFCPSCSRMREVSELLSGEAAA